MATNRTALCRSLLAGDSERPPTEPMLHRLQAGSYSPSKQGHLSAERPAKIAAPGY
jgi:hypothetical protein